MQICSALWSCTSAPHHLAGEMVFNNLRHMDTMCDTLELQNEGNAALDPYGAYCSCLAGFVKMIKDRW